LAAHAGLASRLSECGVEREKLPVLAADAAKQWTGTFNPREANQHELLKLYEQTY
jgi:alcohol dehydrogenase